MEEWSVSPVAKPSFTVYLAGEIKTNWRDAIIEGVQALGLPVKFSTAQQHHESSDKCGVVILGAEEKRFWEDRKAQGINSLRNKILIKDCDILVARFVDRETFPQWEVAFEAGYAAALGKPIIILHPPEYDHMLKEPDAYAQAVCNTPEQVVRILRYVIDGTL